MSKSFSYAQLTKAVEAEIADCAQVAEKCRAGNDLRSALAFRYMAEGAVRLWDRTTTGWQQSDDHARLTALATAVDPDRRIPD
jgi:hypothetical protein